MISWPLAFAIVGAFWAVAWGVVKFFYVIGMPYYDTKEEEKNNSKGEI